MFVGDGTVWLVMQTGQALERISEETGEILEPFPVGTPVQDAAFAFGSLWVVVQEGESEVGDFSIHRYDPNSGVELEEVEVGSIAVDVTPDEATGSIWVGLIGGIERVELVDPPGE